MIDRNARNKLVVIIRRYLDEQITAFQLDELLDDFRDSEDSAVSFVARTMWYHYDDCDDHLIVADKPEWDYFQRLLLLLESNSTVSTSHSRRWSWTQCVAAILLAGCIWISIRTGIGSHLLVFFIPFGIASIVLSRFRHPNLERGPYDEIIAPFSSVRDLRVAHATARGFKKRQYPKQIGARLIRSPIMSFFWEVHQYVLWAIFAPVPLLTQCAPISFGYPVVRPD